MCRCFWIYCCGKQFCCWVVFIFLNLSLFVTVWKNKKQKSARYGIIVNMKGCVKGPASFWRPHPKTRLILFPFFFFWLLLCLTPLMTRNQVEMQCADETHLSDSRALSPHAVFLYVSAFLAWPQFIYIKGKSAAVVTLGNILLPVLVAHIWPLL